MTLLRLAWASLLNRWGTALLTVFTVAVSVTLLLGVDKLRMQARASFAATVSGTDLIVGARTGPVQLLLYSVFRLGDATANISWQSYQELAEHSAVAWAVPISLGDSHRGYRVLGTIPGYFEHFRYGNRRALELAAGGHWQDRFDVVLGSEVARALDYQVGGALVIAHGLGRGLEQLHDNLPFRVSGVLARTGTPVDQSLHVSLEAIEAIHLGWQTGIRLPGTGPAAADLQEREFTPTSITAVFIGLTSRQATFAVQRMINQYRAEPLLAIMPALTLQQLWSLLSVAENALLVVAACVVVAGLLGMLVAILTSLNERRREMAVLRSVGARPIHVFSLLVLESGLLASLGTLLGLMFTFVAVSVLAPYAEQQFGIQLGGLALADHQWWLLAGVVAAGILIGLVPAITAYFRSLSDGMTIRT